MKTTLYLFLLIVGVSMIYYISFKANVWFAKSPKSFSQKVTLTGHRGAAGYAPENTLSSIRKALEIGVVRVEIDVQQTKDGVVVALHDRTLQRTSNGKGEVKNFTFNQVQRLDAGSYFSSDFKGEKIPSLDEIFELVDGKSILLIEIKDGGEYYPNIEENILSSIEKYNAKDWVIIHSFNDLPLIKINKIAPEITLHKLFVGKLPWFPLFLDTKIRYNSYENYPYVNEFSFNHQFVNKATIDQVHALGKKVNVWTANDSIRIQQLIELGVDGIITDYPLYLKH